MGESQLSNIMTKSLLAYVARVGGDDKVSEALELAGESRPLQELNDTSKWSSYDQVHSLFSAAALVMHDHEIGKWAGRELDLAKDSPGIASLLTSMSSPHDAIKLASQIAAKSTTVTDMEAVEIAGNSALVSAITMPPITRDKIFCDYTAQVLARLPTLFGFDEADVIEIECQTRGDRRCLYRVLWMDALELEGDPDRQIQYLKNQIKALNSRVESLEVASADLVSTADISSVLQTITVRASTAAQGQKYLLVARLPGDGELRIHRVGFSEAEARVRAAEILDHDITVECQERLVVEVSSPRHNFGRLAVFFPPGYKFLPHELRQLKAYAGHAAAALEVAAVMEELTERSNALGSTLDLATRLAQATSHQEVCVVLNESIARIFGCVSAAFISWIPEDQVFVRSCRRSSELENFSSYATATEVFGGSPGKLYPSMRSPQLAYRLCKSPEPFAVESHNVDVALGGLLAMGELSSAIISPIISQGELFGVLLIGPGHDNLPPSLRLISDGNVRDQLVGVANIAAPALRNARLLEKVEYEALHDPITSLPNTRLLQDEIVRALSHAERENHKSAVLFADLDNFSSVNDSVGHVVADDVLRAVGLILRSAVRRGDVVARLAGDQFAIVLPKIRDLDDAQVVAKKIVSAFSSPFQDFETTISVSVSIGVAVFPEHGRSYDELLGHADLAMRQAKSRGGDQIKLFQQVTSSDG